ncbi:MAG: hypothetical protein ACT6QV_13000, partial [Microbacterium aurantiacum]
MADTTFPDDAILVLLDTAPDGAPASSGAGLIGAAASIGTPVALVIGDAARATGAAALGAGIVLVAAPRDGLGVAATDALAAASDLVRPAAVLAARVSDTHLRAHETLGSISY